MKKYDVIIVGAGIAGMTAAIYAVRGGKEVLVLESRVEGGQIINTTSIENWPGELGISGVGLTRKIKEQAEELGAEFDYAEVKKIEKNANGWTMIGEDDEKFEASVVILAMGTEPRKLSKKQAADAGERAISYCATCDGALYKNRPVVVVGSGNTAKHETAYLKNIASKVYHIHHDDPIPKDAVAVFVAIGRVPSTNFCDGLVELDENGYIIAGEDCRTSEEGIFVSGDCRTKNLRQLVTAAADGAIAGTEAIKYLG
ncbi:FAD-dependent oxidoreductase [Candidatus Saccharibacteria bacterium]|nr:FAD-dependent oxidoreductase [Candidatus Saccharibacteria bacterium]